MFGRGTKNLEGSVPECPGPWLAKGLIPRTKVAFIFTTVKYIAL